MKSGNCMTKTTGQLREGLRGSGHAVLDFIHLPDIARDMHETSILVGKPSNRGNDPESNVITFRSTWISYPILSIALESMLPISYQEYPRRLEMMTRNSLTGTIGTGVTFALA